MGIRIRMIKITSRSANSFGVESVFLQSLWERRTRNCGQPNEVKRSNIQIFRASWRIDKMNTHNKSMYAEKWLKYQKYPLSVKKKFFDSALECKTNLFIQSAFRRTKRDCSG